VADRSRSRIPVASARYPGGEYTEVARPLREPVARSLEYWARTRGEDPALFEQGSALSYADWNEYADLLADGFAGRGLGSDDVIAVRCRNRIEWAVIALAAAKIDAPLLTLDPDLTGRALRERLIAGRASAIIVGDTDPGAIASTLEGISFRLRASMDMARPGFFNFWDLFPPAAPARFGFSQPSLIAWSAGRLGQAQAVAIPRRRAAPASVSRPPPIETGIVLITVPFHRTWGTTQFWHALGAGRAVAMMRTFDPVQALAAIERWRITHWAAWPETFAQVVTLPQQAIAAANRSSLQELTIGGAMASWSLKTRIVAAFGPILQEAYGSTEAGVIALMPAGRHHERPGSCGRPLRGVVIEIRDANGCKLPPDSIGEVWARTPRSMECGLIGRRSHGHRDSDGFIATGDAGRMDADGFLYLSSRNCLPAPEARRAG
jgi:long-chain acyl-CoA synthetase